MPLFYLVDLLLISDDARLIDNAFWHGRMRSLAFIIGEMAAETFSVGGGLHGPFTVSTIDVANIGVSRFGRVCI